MSKQLISKTITALAVAITLGFAPAANAGLLYWNITGPGFTGQQRSGETLTSLTYYLEGWDVYSTQTWTATAVADEAGDYNFAWNYSGFHAYFDVTAFLNASSPAGGTVSLVNAGPANCCTMPSSGFGYDGYYTFANVNAGDVLRFDFGGRNGDSDARLTGTLTLGQQLPVTAVPEPAAAALFGLALAGLVAARRRRS